MPFPYRMRLPGDPYVSLEPGQMQHAVLPHKSDPYLASGSYRTVVRKSSKSDESRDLLTLPKESFTVFSRGTTDYVA